MPNKLGRRPFFDFSELPLLYFGGNPLAGRAEIFSKKSSFFFILSSLLAIFHHFFATKFAYSKKSLYLCTHKHNG